MQGDVETVSLILPFLVILILSAGIMASVPYIASNLTGVVGIASNAVGLTGLARQGFVNTRQYGTGTAARLVTGKSPHELNHMANTGVVKTGEMIRQSPGALLSAAKAFRKP